MTPGMMQGAASWPPSVDDVQSAGPISISRAKSAKGSRAPNVAVCASCSPFALTHGSALHSQRSERRKGYSSCVALRNNEPVALAPSTTWCIGGHSLGTQHQLQTMLLAHIHTSGTHIHTPRHCSRQSNKASPGSSVATTRQPTLRNLPVGVWRHSIVATNTASKLPPTAPRFKVTEVTHCVPIHCGQVAWRCMPQLEWRRKDDMHGA